MKKHLVIAGTGRAGTSFLVQYLTACGLETHITRNETTGVDENANAGFEDVPFTGTDLPYVIKSPWLFEFVDRLLERDDIELDAVIMPMRDIVEAAASRVILEMRSRHESPHTHAEMTDWESWGLTPGGVVYSLNPLDQARLLAMGFHETIRALVRKRVPIVFVDFPRMIEDAEYLYEALEPAIGSQVSRDAAIAAHRKSADPEKVRTGSDLRRSADAEKASGQPSIRYPSFETLDKSSMLREISRLRKEGDVTGAALVKSEQARTALESELGQTQQRVDALAATVAAHEATIVSNESRHRQENGRLTAELDGLRAAAAQAHRDLARRESELGVLRETAEQYRALQHRFSETEANWRITVESLQASTSWRITRPFRWMVTRVRGH